MTWIFHIFWLLLVIVLFFLILRRIYYFGMQGITSQRERTDSQLTATTHNQQYYVFTVYGSQAPRESNHNSANTDQLPPNYEASRPPPKYEEVIKSPELFAKPPEYNRV